MHAIAGITGARLAGVFDSQRAAVAALLAFKNADLRVGLRVPEEGERACR